MKVLLLAGGLGTRLSEESVAKPKPMTEIGDKPILWHIMKMYSAQGYNDFVILLGYKGYIVKEYFANYFLHQSDVTIDLASNKMEIINNSAEPWKVTLLETGLNTMTGGRIKRAASLIGNERFMLTYGDGVADVDIKKQLAFHEKHGKAITMTGVQPEGRFGALNIGEHDIVHSFKEKPQGDGSWINGGFFICEPRVLDYIANTSDTVFEQEPLQNLAINDELHVYRHNGFWKCMDTLRDKHQLNEMWEKGDAKWKIWK
jgi:glucose-1-phosphate cytidylyltransferase